MADRMKSGFESLDEVADMIAEYNPQRPRPTDLNGLRTNLRRRGDRWYWHWDPKFISDTASLPPTRGGRCRSDARGGGNDPRGRGTHAARARPNE